MRLQAGGTSPSTGQPPVRGWGLLSATSCSACRPHPSTCCLKALLWEYSVWGGNGVPVPITGLLNTGWNSTLQADRQRLETRSSRWGGRRVSIGMHRRCVGSQSPTGLKRPDTQIQGHTGGAAMALRVSPGAGLCAISSEGLSPGGQRPPTLPGLYFTDLPGSTAWGRGHVGEGPCTAARSGQHSS